jgi:Leucine rich repeat
LSLILLTTFLNLTQGFKAKILKCEAVEDFMFGSENIKTCFMDQKTTIYSPGALMSTNDWSMNGLMMNLNKKVHYLPDFVAEQFPNLLAITAFNCSIRQVSNKNFKGLIKLRFLDLGSNKLEKIQRETFEELSHLKVLKLSKKTFFKLTIFDQTKRFFKKRNLYTTEICI